MVKQSKLLTVVIIFLLLSVALIGCSKPNLVEFVVTSLVVTPEIVVADSPATIKADIKNLTVDAGIGKVTLKVNGKKVKTKEVALEGNGTQTVSFDVSRNDSGTYNIEINGVTNILTVVKFISYTNPATKYTVSHPDGWSLETERGTNIIVESPKGYPLLVVDVTVFDKEKTLDEFHQAIIEEFKQTTIVILTDEKVNHTKGFAGYETVLTMLDTGTEYKAKVLTIVSGRLGFRLAVTTKKGQWDAWYAVTDAMLKSFVPPSLDFQPRMSAPVPPTLSMTLRFENEVSEEALLSYLHNQGYKDAVVQTLSNGDKQVRIFKDLSGEQIDNLDLLLTNHFGPVTVLEHTISSGLPSVPLDEKGQPLGWKGQVDIVFKANISDLSPSDIPDVMEATMQTIKKRIAAMGISDSDIHVSRMGTDRFQVSVSGVTDAEKVLSQINSGTLPVTLTVLYKTATE